MSWNYRVVRFPASSPDDDPELKICEVYYTDASSADAYSERVPHSFDPTPFLNGDSIEELGAVLDRMKGALTEPILDLSVFTQDIQRAEKPEEPT